MENVKTTVKGNLLTITIDLDHRGERSTSGKTVRVATTAGNVPIPAPDGSVVYLGVNAYVK